MLLPVLLLMGWFAYEQSPAWFNPAPMWLQPTHADAVLGACEALASLRSYGGAFTTAAGTTEITADAARAEADAVVARQFDVPPGAYSVPAGPSLVRAAFPDSGERLAWLNVAILDHDMPGKVVVVYTDANTNEPLAVVAGVTATAPLESCGGGTVSRRALVRQYLPLIALAGYGGLIAAGMLARGLMRRRRRAADTKTSEL